MFMSALALQGQLSSLLLGLSNSTGLYKLDLSGNYGMQGPLVGNTTTQGLYTLAQVSCAGTTRLLVSAA